MAQHARRCITETTPGTWLVKCRDCPKPRRHTPRPERAVVTVDSIAAAHAYWRDHEATPEHQHYASPESRRARQQYQAWERHVGEVTADMAPTERLVWEVQNPYPGPGWRATIATE